jgi:hypothetical protein
MAARLGGHIWSSIGPEFGVNVEGAQINVLIFPRWPTDHDHIPALLISLQMFVKLT